MSENHSSDTPFREAFFALSETVIARGFFNPDVNWKGFRVPFFTIEECGKIIKILESLDPVEYRFTRSEEDTGYLVTDVSNHGEKTHQKGDITIRVEDELIKVNGLADGWCWEEISEDAYREWNIMIKQGEMFSTVEELRKLE